MLENIFKDKKVRKEMNQKLKNYSIEEKEIYALVECNGGALRTKESFWSASAYTLAIIDCGSGELTKGRGSLGWFLTEEDCRKFNSSYPYNFESGGIYKLLVRELIYPEGMNRSNPKAFHIIKVLEEKIENKILKSIYEEYLAPVIFEDEVLGKFELNKRFSCFEGNITWSGKTARMSIDVDKDDEESWEATIKPARIFFEERERLEKEIREYAADKLTDLANDWLYNYDPEAEEITKNDFAKRIVLTDVSVNDEGSYEIFFADDDMFAGHCIIVDGDLEEGLSDAHIAG